MDSSSPSGFAQGIVCVVAGEIVDDLDGGCSDDHESSRQSNYKITQRSMVLMLKLMLMAYDDLVNQFSIAFFFQQDWNHCIGRIEFPTFIVS